MEIMRTEILMGEIPDLKYVNELRKHKMIGNERTFQ